MRPTQKELNEFVLDWVEFLGKHFPAFFDKTRIAGGNQDVEVRIRNLKAGAELEIQTGRGDLAMVFGSVRWDYRGSASKEDLFARAAADLLGIFTGGIAAVGGEKAGSPLGGFLHRQGGDEEAAERFRAEHPDCDSVTVTRWTSGTLPGAVRDAS